MSVPCQNGVKIDSQRQSNDELLLSSHDAEIVDKTHNLPYSLIRCKPERSECVSPESPVQSAIELLSNQSVMRAGEIIQEHSSRNTERAYKGDLIYWQAWLSAIGHSFDKPIAESEIIAFIVQHSEGLDPAIDEKLVTQGFKTKHGPHKLATIKRRIASLSVFLDGVKWDNPCRSKAIRYLLQKLTKKYGDSRPAGKAITKDILNDMLETCGDKLIDIRDAALLLFTWGSGGRRRTEVVVADMKDLLKTPEGDFTYTIPHSKTDQQGSGHTVPVKGRAARALQKWLSAAGIMDGPLFRAVNVAGVVRGALSDADVCRIVKRRLKKAGYDETKFGAHSLRSGFVTEAGRRGKPLGDVMQLTTHRTVGTVMKYYQAGNIINNSAANLAD